jgi:hypothetical protein
METCARVCPRAGMEAWRSVTFILSSFLRLLPCPGFSFSSTHDYACGGDACGGGRFVVEGKLLEKVMLVILTVKAGVVKGGLRSYHPGGFSIVLSRHVVSR